MRIGILELKRDEFMTEVVKKLKGHKVSYLRLRDWNVPLTSNYKVIIDRLSYDNELLRELLKNYSLDGTYVINNPFSASLTNKIMDSKICADLGIPIPETRIFPIYDEEVGETVNEPNWESLRETIHFPVMFKPYDGYGWTHVYYVSSIDELKNMYNAFKEENIMLVQRYVSPNIYRAFCINKEKVMIKKWAPPQKTNLKEIENIVDKIKKWTIKLNKALDLDFNSVEWSLDAEGNPFLIDAFNDVPWITKGELEGKEFRWVVDKFAECVDAKARGNETNKTVFGRKDLA